MIKKHLKKRFDYYLKTGAFDKFGTWAYIYFETFYIPAWLILVLIIIALKK